MKKCLLLLVVVLSMLIVVVPSVNADDPECRVKSIDFTQPAKSVMMEFFKIRLTEMMYKAKSEKELSILSHAMESLDNDPDWNEVTKKIGEVYRIKQEVRELIYPFEMVLEFSGDSIKHPANSLEARIHLQAAREAIYAGKDPRPHLRLVKKELEKSQ